MYPDGIAAHFATAVDEKSRGRVGILEARPDTGMNDLHCFGHRLIFVGDDRQIREIGLGFLSGFLVVIGNDDDADVVLGKFLMLLFELT